MDAPEATESYWRERYIAGRAQLIQANRDKAALRGQLLVAKTEADKLYETLDVCDPVKLRVRLENIEQDILDLRNETRKED